MLKNPDNESKNYIHLAYSCYGIKLCGTPNVNIADQNVLPVGNLTGNGKKQDLSTKNIKVKKNRVTRNTAPICGGPAPNGKIIKLSCRVPGEVIISVLFSEFGNIKGTVSNNPIPFNTLNFQQITILHFDIVLVRKLCKGNVYIILNQRCC